ncbi:MAG: hypothetical protein RIR33_660 [Pseudomonadota bacterium]|jgi:hemolysin D
MHDGAVGGDETSQRRSRAVDTDFLPAALEILETPPSPVGRLIVWIVIAAAVAALLWATFAQLDMVAIAEGRVIPRSRLQSVEAPEAGIIRAIHVTEGQRVDKGQLLLELDPTFADADAASARIELETAELARSRSEALLQRAAGAPVRFRAPANVSAAAASAEASAVRARVASLDARLSGIEQRIVGAEASIAGASAQLRKLKETRPLLEEQDQILKRLSAEGATTRPQLLDMSRRLIENEHDMSAREAEIQQTRAEIETLRRERAQAIEDFRAQAASEKAEAEAIVATRSEGVRKATTREGYQTLVAPVSGMVNEISVTTLGEVAEGGAPLITIVPEGEELILEALVLNRDVGFVSEGQEAIIKLDAYPFTRHGYLIGRLEHVSPDAIVDEARGLVYPIRVRPLSSKLRGLQHAGAIGPEGTMAIALSPGMSAKVELITGRRTVLDYLLSPIAKATQEAARER